MTAAVSSFYLTNFLAMTVSRTQTELTIAQSELASGRYDDAGLHLGSASGFHAAMKSENSQIQTFIASNTLVAGGLDTAQNAIQSMRKSAQTLTEQLAVWTPTDKTISLAALGSNGLEAFAANLNSAYNGQHIFGGINSGIPPIDTNLLPPQSPTQVAIKDAFTTQFGFPPDDARASTISLAILQDFIDTKIAAKFDEAAWSASWSRASSTDIRVDISRTESVRAATNANSPAFRSLAQAYVMLGLFGDSPLSGAARSQLVSDVSGLLSAANGQLISIESGLGATSKRINDATEAMKAKSVILQSQINQLEQVDPYATATTVNLLTTRLQVAYQMTAQLQQLSLVKYLRG